MKALICGECADIQALQDEWRTCKCGNVSARWTNALLGIAEFKARNREKAFLLGMNNRLLGPALRGELAMWEDCRAAHDIATKAPNHIFDESRANCWAVVVAVGRTNDVKWASPESEPVTHHARVCSGGTMGLVKYVSYQARCSSCGWRGPWHEPKNEKESIEAPREAKADAEAHEADSPTRS